MFLSCFFYHEVRKSVHDEHKVTYFMILFFVALVYSSCSLWLISFNVIDAI